LPVSFISLRFERVDNLGAYRIPPETGILIPSAFVNHGWRNILAMKLTGRNWTCAWGFAGLLIPWLFCFAGISSIIHFGRWNLFFGRVRLC
jgi:hypothetical protein